MTQTRQINIGTQVHYISEKGKENGIIKSFSEDKKTAFVVYNCAGEWKKYFNYTAQSTNINQLDYGWVDENGKILPEFCDHYFIPFNSKWASPNRVRCINCGLIND